MKAIKENLKDQKLKIKNLPDYIRNDPDMALFAIKIDYKNIQYIQNKIQFCRNLMDENDNSDSFFSF